MCMIESKGTWSLRLLNVGAKSFGAAFWLGMAGSIPSC